VRKFFISYYIEYTGWGGRGLVGTNKKCIQDTFILFALHHEECSNTKHYQGGRHYALTTC
jgi:hypothetical protein